MAWPTMPSVALPVVDYNTVITEGAASATFVFRVAKQPATAGMLLSIGSQYDTGKPTFIVKDVTNYTATPNPLSVFGTSFTTMLLRALRSLVMSTSTMIPKPGEYVTFGSASSSIVETVDITQLSEKTTDVFLVSCNVREPSVTTTQEDASPKVSRGDEVPPWQLPTDVHFETQTGDALTLGYAYQTQDLDGSKEYSDSELLRMGFASGAKRIAVTNYADDPFSSPPAFQKEVYVLRVTKSFLRGSGVATNVQVAGVVNDDDINVDVNGVMLRFPSGTLSPSSLNIVAKIYKKPIPWLPKTKHPLDKTYGELFFGYSKATANRIAVNKTSEIIVVHQPIKYLEMSASFVFRPEGFGVWIANRGYMEKNDSVPDKKVSITDVKTGTIKEAWLDANGKKTSTGKLWRGFTVVKPSTEVEKLLRLFFAQTADDTFSWATAADNYGK